MRRTRLALLAAIAAATPLSAIALASSAGQFGAGHYVLDPRHSSLIAQVSHMGVSLYTIRFDALAATLDYDPAHPDATRVEASVDPGSLDVNADYAKTFAEEFLQASRYPKATFVSTAIQPSSTPGQGVMTGDLTLMGVTRPVTFNVTFVGAGHEPLPPPLGVRAAGFEATATIRRSDYGSTYLKTYVGDDVTIQIEAEFDKR
jgi:polyisoprenoid-binding protein YceI